MRPSHIWGIIQAETFDFISILSGEKEKTYDDVFETKKNCALDKFMVEALDLLNTQNKAEQTKREAVDEQYMFLANKAAKILSNYEKELLQNEKYFVQLLRLTANLARTNYLSPTYASRDPSSVELMINVRLKALNEVLDSPKVSKQEIMFVNNALGESYNHLFEVTGNSDNLEKTIKHLSNAVSLAEEMNDFYHTAFISSHTKNACFSLYEITRDDKALHEALNFSTKMIQAGVDLPLVDQYYFFTDFAIMQNIFLKKKFKYDDAINFKEKSKDQAIISHEENDLKMAKESLIASAHSIYIYEHLSPEQKNKIKVDSVSKSYADAYYSASLLEFMTKDHSKYLNFQISCLDKLVDLGNDNQHLFGTASSTKKKNSVEHYSNYASNILRTFKDV